MDRQFLDQLKARISLLSYLEQHDWEPARRTHPRQVAGCCPLHAETQPSFFIHTGKNLFYCHGCGQGGDVIRLAQLLHGLSFPATLAHLCEWLGRPELIAATITFYQSQLGRYPEAVQYLESRGISDPETIRSLGIGYAPGACLRAHLTQRGYGAAQLRQASLIDEHGRDRFWRRVVFPCGGTLYGRSIDAQSRHRFLSGGKGPLHRWELLRQMPEVILVEGLFDLAALWQAGLRNVTCALGTHLNRIQHRQLATFAGTLWIAFDGDAAGRSAASALAEELHQAGRTAWPVMLPQGQDPASWLAAGATRRDFELLLQELPL